MENHYTAAELVGKVLDNLTVETDSNELATAQSNELTVRLTDRQLAELEAVAKAPLPRQEPCDGAHFAKCMRSLSLLPSRADDETKGELRLAIYQRMLGKHPNGAISYLVERALAELNWFPTPKQCLDIIADWRAPISEQEGRRNTALRLIEKDKWIRFEDIMGDLERRELEGEALANVPERMKLIAVERGYLQLTDGAFVVRHEKRKEWQ